MLKATVSGSFQKFYQEVGEAIYALKDCGVEVLSPKSGRIVSHIDGFVTVEGDLVRRIDQIPEGYLQEAIRAIEDSHLKAIQGSDFLWVVIRNGYFGVSTAFEMGWAVGHNVPIYYSMKEFGNVREPIIRCYATPVDSIEELAWNFNPEEALIVSPEASRRLLHGLARKTEPARDYQGVAVGGVIVDFSKEYRQGEPRDVLLVKTRTWGGRYTLVGGRVEEGEDLTASLERTVRKQTGLKANVGDTVCAFRELADSGFYRPRPRRAFVDSVVGVESRDIELDETLLDYFWASPEEAAKDSRIEDNARKTMGKYLENAVL